MGDNYSGTDRYVVRLRGLPWSATDKDIVSFLYGCSVANGNAINRPLSKEGRSSGEAYVELASEQDYNRALEKDRDRIGRRYIEVFAATVDEMEFVLGKSGNEDYNVETTSDSVVRMRGLPFQCSREEIAQFFSGLDIVPNGITVQVDGTGRCTGTAFVEFANTTLVERALGKHKEKIGHRYIELYKSSSRELKATMHEFGGNQRPNGGGRGRPGPYDRPMRGNRGMHSNRGGFHNNRGGRGGRMMGDGNWGDNNYNNFDNNNYDDDYTWDDDSYGGGRFGGGGGGGGNQRNNFRGGNQGNVRRGGHRGGGNNMRRGDWQDEEDYYDEDEGMSSEYVVHMLGLPFKATDQEIIDFFSPVVPLRVHREYGRDGRITGEANVEFASSQDAQAAMLKDKDSIQHRYIELFLRDGSENNKGPSRNRQQRGYDGGGGGGGNRGRGSFNRYF